jgi:hypothetical protein
VIGVDHDLKSLTKFRQSKSLFDSRIGSLVDPQTGRIAEKWKSWMSEKVNQIADRTISPVDHPAFPSRVSGRRKQESRADHPAFPLPLAAKAPHREEIDGLIYFSSSGRPCDLLLGQ